jgi:hypothetical protein
MNLLCQNHGVNDYAVADNVDTAIAEDTRRYGVKHIAFVIEMERVARIGSALEAGDYVVTGRQHVNNFAFAFVAPLQTENYIYLFHNMVLEKSTYKSNSFSREFQTLTHFLNKFSIFGHFSGGYKGYLQ